MSSIFKAIGSFFKKLWNVIRKVLAVVLIIIAVIVIIWACIFCPPLGGVLFGVAFSSATAAFAFGCVLLVGAFLVDKDTAATTVGNIGKAAGDAAESVGSAVGDIVSGVASGLFDSGFLMVAAVAVGAWFLLSGSNSTADLSVSEETDLSPESRKNKGTVVVASLESAAVVNGTNFALLEA